MVLLRLDYFMSKVIGFMACGFTLAACSASIPGLDFLKSSPPTAAIQFESEPAGAEVKASGQTCRTPCELTLEVAELSATFALKGYRPQTISVRSESSGVLSTPRFVPNPVHADLRPVVASAKQRIRAKIAAAAKRPAAMSEKAPGSSSAPEGTALTNSAAYAR
jgi:hypothetical protein